MSTKNASYCPTKRCDEIKKVISQLKFVSAEEREDMIKRIKENIKDIRNTNDTHVLMCLNNEEWKALDVLLKDDFPSLKKEAFGLN